MAVKTTSIRSGSLWVIIACVMAHFDTNNSSSSRPLNLIVQHRMVCASYTAD